MKDRLITRLGQQNGFWKDEVVALIKAAGQNPSSKLVWLYEEGTLQFKEDSDLLNYAIANYQINHDWKQGTEIRPHLHWKQIGSNVPNWMIQYRWQTNGQDFSTSWTSVAWDGQVFASPMIEPRVQINTFPGIQPPEGNNVSDILQIRLIRDIENDSGLFGGDDPFEDDVEAISFDIHYRIDYPGSKQEFKK